MKDFSLDRDLTEGYVLTVDKPYGWTSSDVVRKIRYLLRSAGYRKIKVGHAGTLDPLATGVLVVCIGRATKQADALQAEEKEYVAGIRLGATTASFDLEHPVDATYPTDHITESAVREALASMTGEQEQIPPLFSAKQIAGRRAYDYAREGEEVEMKPVRITVVSAEAVDMDLPDVTVDIVCSKGTYIRSFARDLGMALESGAHLTSLRRTRSGSYTLDDAYTLDEIESVLRPDAPERRDDTDKKNIEPHGSHTSRRAGVLDTE